MENWIANLDIPLIDASSVCSGCKVHEGFWNTWETVASDVISQIESALSSYPDYTLVTTGHSLGGALAAIAATVFRASGYTVQLVCFSSARCPAYSIMILIILSITMASLVSAIWPWQSSSQVKRREPITVLPTPMILFQSCPLSYWVTITSVLNTGLPVVITSL